MREHPILTKKQQEMRAQLEAEGFGPGPEGSHPLLTKNQLIDWLIYHCPMEDVNPDDPWHPYPFRVAYHPKRATAWFSCCGETPLLAYLRIVELIVREPKIHREITDLYWYWTI